MKLKFESEWQEECKKTKNIDDKFFKLSEVFFNDKGDVRLLLTPFYLIIAIVYFILTLPLRIEITTKKLD